MRQLAAMLKHIDVRIHNEFVAQAALQGVKLPAKTASVTDIPIVDPLSNAEEELMMKSLQEARMRKMRRG